MSDVQDTGGENIYKVRMHQWRMAFFGLIILIAGIVIGAGIAMIGAKRFMPMQSPAPEQSAKRMMNALRGELELSPEQRHIIEPIIARHMNKLDDIRRNARPVIEQEMQQMNEEIMPVLNEQQRVMWQHMIKRMPVVPPMGQGPGARGPRPEGFNPPSGEKDFDGPRPGNHGPQPREKPAL